MRHVIDGLGGVKTVIALEDGNLHTGMVQDSTAIAENAKALHNAGAFGSDDMRHVARIPMVEIERYCNENGVSFQEFCASEEHKNRLIQIPDLAHFRIWAGRLQ